MAERIPAEKETPRATLRAFPGRLISRTSRGRRLFAITAFCVVVLTVSPILDIVFDNDAFLASGVCAVAAAVFFGVFYDHTEVKAEISRADAVRDAAAATFILVYLVLVSINTFFSQVGTGEGQEARITTTTLLNSFTQLTGVVVAFSSGPLALISTLVIVGGHVTMRGKQVHRRLRGTVHLHLRSDP